MRLGEQTMLEIITAKKNEIIDTVSVVGILAVSTKDNPDPELRGLYVDLEKTAEILMYLLRTADVDVKELLMGATRFYFEGEDIPEDTEESISELVETRERMDDIYDRIQKSTKQPEGGVNV